MVRTYVKWCRILWHAAKILFWLEEMLSDMTELNNQSHLRFEEIFTMHELKSLIWKLHCFWQLFCLFDWQWFWYEWAYDDLKKRFNTLWKCLLIHFLLKTTLSTTFSPFFQFLTIDLFMVTAKGTKSVFLAPVKIVVNFLHRVCTMLQLIWTCTLSQISFCRI